MLKSKFMKISYCVIASLVAFAVLLNFSVAPVMAATVESLPVVDVDVVGSYDAENVYVECNGVKYAIPRNTSTGYGTSKYYPWTYPLYFEKVGVGSSAPASYWYSPSLNRILVISSSRRILNENSTSVMSNDYTFMVRAYGHNQFQLFAKTGTNHKYNSTVAICSIWDCETNSIISSQNFSCDADNLINTFSIDDGAGGSYYDLVCIFSTYEIEGFYESNDSIITPDYYFDYQYLFYTEAKGYVFVDSSEPLKNITNSNDPTKAMLNFSEECNKHVYTSQLGNSWNLSSTVNSMYGASYTMDYSYFFDSAGGTACYTLVYCNDEGYEDEPLYVPDYNDIRDVTDILNNFIVDGKPLSSGGRGNSYTFEELRQLNELDYYSFIVYGFTHEYYTRYKVVYDDSSFEYVYDLESGRYGSFSAGDKTFSYCELEHIPTVACYLYDLNMTLDDTNLLVTTYGEALHNDLKSVFDNITVTNTYLYDIKALIKDLPDYSNSLDKTNVLLSDLNDKLTNLDINSPSNSGGGSSSTDITNDFLLSLDDEMLIYLNDIKNYSDKIYDEIHVSVGERVIDELFDDIFDEEALDDLFNDDFVTNAVSSIAAGGLISGQFGNITLSGASEAVPFVNSTITGFYNASGWKVQSVLLLGATMLVVNVVVRKGF